MGDTMSVIRAYRVVLDPTRDQQQVLSRHVGAARWAYNHALGAKVAAHRRWRQEVAWATYEHGVDEATARTMVKVPIPAKPAIQRALNAVKGDSRAGVDGVCPWWHEVSTYAFQSALLDADRAWANWLSSLRGDRAGRRVGYPRFKKRGRTIDSVRIHHDVKRPTIRPDGYRRLIVPRVGSIRLRGNIRQLTRRIVRGTAILQSVTLTRRRHRWYAAILAIETIPAPVATRQQKMAGTVGVDLGVHHMAALSDGTLIDNPRHLRKAQQRLVAAQRALSRTQRGSTRRQRARERLARLHQQLAEQRAGYLHQLTKHLATGWAQIAIEDLNVAGMTRAPRPVPNPERAGAWLPNGRRAKAGLNRSILDTAPGEIRRQLTYKTTWYGSSLYVVDRWFPSSQTCSVCGRRNPSLTLRDRVYTCPCGVSLDRDTNAALTLAKQAGGIAAPVAPDTEETLNARRASDLGQRRRPSVNAGRPPRGSPQPSNRLGVHAQAAAS